MRFTVTIILTFICIFNVFSQNEYSNYILPVNIPIHLSANFGELRKNHFHTGIDIKTEGVEGKEIVAIEDGYVSRIKISPYGYGKTLYITHPKSGHVSVYAHLNWFPKKINDALLSYQYYNKSSLVDFELPADSILVKQGEIIAYSGNSGGSQGPHLHFEIRDAETEHALNPLQFYPQIEDLAKPRIYDVVLYPLNDTSHVQSSHEKRFFKASLISSGRYSIQSNIACYGEIGIGILCKDFIHNSPNKFGTYRILMINEKDTIYSHSLDEINFNESKFINSMVDYEYWNRTSQWIQQLYKDTTSKLNIYDMDLSRSILKIENRQTKHLKIVVLDFHGNQSEVTFSLIGDERMETYSDSCTYRIHPNHSYSIQKANAIIDFPHVTTYNSFCFIFETDTSNIEKNQVSPLFKIGNTDLPVQNSYRVQLPFRTEDCHLNTQIYIGQIRNKGINYKGGIVSEGIIAGRLNSFGNFAVFIDTIAPSIYPISLYNNVSLKSRNSIRFTIIDKESGISNYRAYIDGDWVPLFYDYKNDKLIHSFDTNKHQKDGKTHSFRLVVEDNCNNENEFQFNYIR